MSRIAKADVNRALDTAGKTLIKIGGADGKISRAEVKSALATDKVARKQAPLVDILFKFVDNRDFRKGAQVTASDVKRAIEYAKKSMVAKYDLDNNGLSKDEIKKMSLTGKRAVDLAKALKASAARPTTAEHVGGGEDGSSGRVTPRVTVGGRVGGGESGGTVSGRAGGTE